MGSRESVWVGCIMKDKDASYVWVCSCVCVQLELYLRGCFAGLAACYDCDDWHMGYGVLVTISFNISYFN